MARLRSIQDALARTARSVEPASLYRDCEAASDPRLQPLPVNMRRSRRGSGGCAVAGVALVAALALPRGIAPAREGEQRPAEDMAAGTGPIPSDDAVRDAAGFAAGRGARWSFAVVDADGGLPRLRREHSRTVGERLEGTAARGRAASPPSRAKGAARRGNARRAGADDHLLRQRRRQRRVRAGRRHGTGGQPLTGPGCAASGWTPASGAAPSSPRRTSPASTGD